MGEAFGVNLRTPMHAMPFQSLLPKINGHPEPLLTSPSVSIGDTDVLKNKEGC